MECLGCGCCSRGRETEDNTRPRSGEPRAPSHEPRATSHEHTRRRQTLRRKIKTGRGHQGGLPGGGGVFWARGTPAWGREPRPGPWGHCASPGLCGRTPRPCRACSCRSPPPPVSASRLPPDASAAGPQANRTRKAPSCSWGSANGLHPARCRPRRGRGAPSSSPPLPSHARRPSESRDITASLRLLVAAPAHALRAAAW